MPASFSCKNPPMTATIGKRIGPPAFYRQALKIALPAMLQQLVMSLVSLVDNFMVAGLGDVNMAAVNVANQLNFIFFVLTNTLTMAGGIYIAQFKGSGDEAGMKHAFRFNVFATGLVSVIYLVLSQVMPEAMLGIMLRGNAVGPQIIAEGAAYLRIVSVTFVFIGFSTSVGAALRVTGDSKTPLLFSVAGTLTNTLLNWILIYGNLGAPKLGVAGAAIATDVARAVEFFFFLRFLVKKKPPFAFKALSFFKIDPKIFKGILSRSWMMIFSEGTWVLTETIMSAIFNGRGGAEVVAGIASSFTIANIFFLAFTGIHTATGAIVGVTLGADRLDEAREQARWIKSGAVIMGIALGCVEAVSVLIIPLVFGNLSAEARAITRSMVWALAVFMPLWTLLNAQFAVSRSGGDALMGFMVDVIVSLVLFLPLLFSLALLTPIHPVALFICAKSTDLVKTAVAEWWLKKERWLKNLTSIHSKTKADA
jgi:putative MATE family efflux protein